MFRSNSRINQPNRSAEEYSEKVIEIKRVCKKTTGGNKVSFRALCVVGDRKGRVGLGLGKAADVSSAIKKSFRFAKKRLVKINLKGTTIPYAIRFKRGAAQILLKPAPEGTGIIAGGPVRAVVEALGITDIVSKILGTKNKTNNVYATLEALKTLKPVKSN